MPPQGEGSEQQVACSKWVLGGKGEPSIQLQVINGTAWLLLPSGFPWEGQPLWVGRVVYSSSSSFPGPSPGRGQPHLSITLVSQRVLSIEKALCHSGESQFALQAAAVALLSWSQLYSQHHLPSAFSLIRVQSQHSLPFSISLPPSPSYSYYHTFSSSFLCPSVMSSSCKG